MRKVLIILGLVILTSVFAFAVASVSLAECPPGQAPFTIVTPTGKVIEVCVPNHAVDRVGGPSDVVIAAICPCFSQEDVENVLTADPDAFCQVWEGNTPPKEGYLPCTDVTCYDSSWEPLFQTWVGPAEASSCHFCVEDPPLFCRVSPPNYCYSLATGDDLFITEEEAAACVAILKTFVP